MKNMFELKGKLQQIYANYSKIIDKSLQFILAFATFFMINKEVGYMSMLANPVIALGLSVICAFLPPVATALFAAGLILAHLYTVSLGVMAVTAIIFLLMFIFYVRFTPKMAIIIILTALAFMFKVPYVLPVACGLLLTPISSVPISFGVIGYYTIDYVKGFVADMKEPDLLGDVGNCAKGIFQNKEMWVMVIAFVICVLVVYNVRRMSMTQAWKIAIISGAAVNIIFIIAGGMAFGVHASYATLFVGNIVAIIVGLILEIGFFAVDYSRSETLQYEDDEYYYYVKAVPKINVAAQEKTVKKINSREEMGEETQIIDAEENRRRNAKAERPRKKTRPEPEGKKSGKKEAPERVSARKRAPKAKSSNVPQNTEHLLLTQSLQKELNLDKKQK